MPGTISSSCIMELDEKGMELTPHGSVSFPAACFDITASRLRILPHWHDDLELLVVTDGVCVVELGSQRFEIQTGQGLFVNAGTVHGMAQAEKDGNCFRSVVFDARLVAGSRESALWHYIQPILENQSLKWILFDGAKDWHHVIIDRILDVWNVFRESAFGFEFGVRDALSQILMEIFKQYPSPHKAPTRKAIRNEQRLKQMLEFVESHYGEAVMVRDLAGAAAISESECRRCFRETIGASPMGYLREFRLQKAAALLERTELESSEIGLQCGFEDAGYFAKCFRSWCGLAPTEYRRAAGCSAAQLIQ